MEPRLMEAVAGLIVGVITGLGALRAAKKERKDGMTPIADKQDEVLRAINLTREDLQGLGERVDQRMNATDTKNESLISGLETRVGRLEGRMDSMEKVQAHLGCPARAAALEGVTEGSQEPDRAGTRPVGDPGPQPPRPGTVLPARRGSKD